MKKILIAGAEGGLGKAWVRRLKPEFDVTACSHADLDVASAPDVARVLSEIRPDVVLNCAGRTNLDVCELSRWDAFRANRDGAEQIARACAKVEALPVYFSTDLVFDGGKLQPYREEDAPNPLNTYGESKLAGELQTASACHRSLIVRSGWIYGQPGRHFLQPLRGDKPFETIGTQVGQATWIEDFMDAVLFLLRGGKTGRWHVASLGAVTQEEVVKRAREMLGGGAPSRRRGIEGRPGLPGTSVLDVGKLAAAGHSMRGWEAGLKAYLKA
jgi:dTDP-4-dehydrorhamnose reductase